MSTSEDMEDQESTVAVQACAACSQIALALEAEVGPCCLVGNLTAKLEACEAKHMVAFELANAKAVENTQLDSDLSVARSKVSELELRVQALEEQVAKYKEEVELSNKKIAELPVESAVHGMTEAITGAQLDESLETRREKLPEVCALVFVDRACKRLRWSNTKTNEFDLYGNLGGDYVFGEFKFKPNLLIADVVSGVKQFCRDFPGQKAHVLVSAGAGDIEEMLENPAPRGYDDVAASIVQPLAELKAQEA